MKKALNLILVYFILLISGFILGTLLYSLYLSATEFRAGTPVVLFNSIYLTKAFIYICVCHLFLICPFLIYYRVRHAWGISQTIAFAGICLLNWAVIFPSAIRITNYIVNNNNFLSDTTELTGSYFRTVNNKIYYLTEDFGIHSDTPVVTIDSSKDEAVEYGFINENDNHNELFEAGKNYRDIIIKNTFTTTIIPILVNFRILIKYAVDSLDKGFFAYICFLSLALVLCSVYGCSSLFSWRLLNVAIIVILTSGILIFNSQYFLPEMDGVKNAVYEIGFIKFMERHIENAFLVCINVLFSVIFILTGILKFVLSRKKN